MYWVVIGVSYFARCRSLFDRVTSLRLPVKRIKFLFDRYLAFETAHGSEDTVRAVRQKALDYAASDKTESSWFVRLCNFFELKPTRLYWLGYCYVVRHYRVLNGIISGVWYLYPEMCFWLLFYGICSVGWRIYSICKWFAAEVLQ